MTNLEKLNSIFCEVFSVDASVLNADFDKNSVESWDSVHQLSLTSSVEDEFDIMLMLKIFWNSHHTTMPRQSWPNTKLNFNGILEY